MGQTLILEIISILFVIRQYKYVLYIWIHGFQALVLQEMIYFPPFFLKLKLIPQIGQTWILVIISNILVIAHNKHIFLIGIHNIDALVLQEKLFFHHFP